MGTSVRPLEAKSCSNCLDIHLSDYNLFLLEDYSGGHVVEGKVAAGGNISMSKFALGEKLSADNLYNAVVAGGTLTPHRGRVQGRRLLQFEGDGMFVYFKGEDTCLNVFNTHVAHSKAIAWFGF